MMFARHGLACRAHFFVYWTLICVSGAHNCVCPTYDVWLAHTNVSDRIMFVQRTDMHVRRASLFSDELRFLSDTYVRARCTFSCTHMPVYWICTCVANANTCVSPEHPMCWNMPIKNQQSTQTLSFVLILKICVDFWFCVDFDNFLYWFVVLIFDAFLCWNFTHRFSTHFEAVIDAIYDPLPFVSIYAQTQFRHSLKLWSMQSMTLYDECKLLFKTYS